MLVTDAYRLLEIDPRASEEQIKNAHRDLMKVWHPDRFGNDERLRLKAEEKLKAINEAWETIQDARQRGGWRGGFEEQASSSRPRSAPAEAPATPQRVSSARSWAISLGITGIVVLFRRPGAAGLAIALVLFIIAWMLFRSSARKR